MPTWLQVAFIIVVFSGLSVLGLYTVRVLVPLERLKANHEVAGFTFGVIGAFYGLLLAFVIVAAWERFDRADAEVQSEAIALGSLYRLSKGFPQPVQAELQRAIRSYAQNCVEAEWPGMQKQLSGRVDNLIGTLGLWAIIANYAPQTSRQTLLADKSYDQIQALSEARALRYMYGSESFPSVVWLVIYAGLFITIGFSYFFGLETFDSQALMCAIFSSLLGLTILAILELSHPYQGSVVVSDAPLRLAIMRMNEMDKVAFSGTDGQAQFALSADPAPPPR
ncbi:MAG: DUF4239 domain-containing protein [Candidatus Binataceae bacterium]